MPKKKKTGRPTKLTAEAVEAFADALRRTWYVETAADLIGVERRTVYYWIKKGKHARKGLLRTFFLTVKQVMAAKEATNVATIEAAAANQWQAAAWLNERRSPERWGSNRFEMTQIRKEVAEIRKAIADERKRSENPVVPPSVAKRNNGTQRAADGNGQH
jgi:hypothetical protein